MRFSREIKYLGIIINDNLLLNSHKAQVCERIRRANRTLHLVRHYVPYPILRTIYYTPFHILIMTYKFGDKIYQETPDLLDYKEY